MATTQRKAACLEERNLLVFSRATGRYLCSIAETEATALRNLRRGGTVVFGIEIDGRAVTYVPN